MGIYTDLLASNNSIDVSAPRVALDRSHVQELRGWRDAVDTELKTSFAARNEVQTIKQYASNPTGGTFTLSFTLRDGTTFTTAGIAFDATAGTIESAIDTAATGTVTGWTNGDITVTGGDLTTADVTLTFDGASVDAENHAQTTIDGAGLTGGSLDTPAEATVTEGQTDRKALAALFATGAVNGTVPAQGANPTDWTAGDKSLPRFPSTSLIRELAREASLTDLNDTILTDVEALYP